MSFVGAEVHVTGGESLTQRMPPATLPARPHPAVEVPDRTRGALGRTVTLADIATFATGDPEIGRRYAEDRLARRRTAPAAA
jgi:hypothetical protein